MAKLFHQAPVLVIRGIGLQWPAPTITFAETFLSRPNHEWPHPTGWDIHPSARSAYVRPTFTCTFRSCKCTGTCMLIASVTIELYDGRVTSVINIFFKGYAICTEFCASKKCFRRYVHRNFCASKNKFYSWRHRNFKEYTNTEFWNRCWNHRCRVTWFQNGWDYFT